MKLNFSISAAVAGLFLFVASADAATLYVNPSTGNDATTKAANTAATPWRTIGRAAWGSTNRNAPVASQAAAAGDTVIIAAGTYNFSGTIGDRWGVVYNPVNEGTSATNQITFLAQGNVVLTAPVTRSPVIGCNGRDHIVWRGRFVLDEASIEITPDTGTVVMTGGAVGCGVDGVHIDGDGVPPWTDNHTGVRFERCTSCFVRNSTITNVHHPNANHNGSGVMLYDSYNTLIEHNNIYDVDNAVYIKGVALSQPQSGTIVRFNSMSDCYECVTGLATRDSRIYQNVIRDSHIGLALVGYASGANDHPVGDWFFNNTIDSMTGACIFVQGGAYHQNVRIWNNILTGCSLALYREGGSFPSGSSSVSWEHNNYFTFGNFATDGGSHSFAQWRSTFSQDSAAPGAITTDPRYANASANDFRLCTGAGAPHANCTTASPARTLGVDLFNLDGDSSTTDIIPAGAYVTNNEVIGPGGGATAPPPTTTTPSAPTNLRIIGGF